MTSRSKMYKIVQYARHDSGVEHGGLTHREALDMQHHLTKCAGSRTPAYMYRIEENAERKVQEESAGTSTKNDSNTSDGAG